jgi:hypothetical protein
MRAAYVRSAAAPSREELAAIARDYSPDVATLLFLEAVGTRPDARALRERFDAAFSLARRVGVDAARPELPGDQFILFVPGWFYVSHGAETNADSHIQRRLLARWGVPHRLVPVRENGTVQDNARVVANAVRAVPRDIVSSS